MSAYPAYRALSGSSTRLGLLVDSADFWRQLRDDIARAEDSILIQTLTFEGDSVGMALANALRKSRASVRRVIVDSFTRFIQNDRFLLAPASLLDPALRAEARATRRTMRGAERDGVQIVWSNPVGFLLRKFAARNHKKSVVIDGRIAYIGGVNFSEHNFAWHDLMLRIVDPDVASFLHEDFEATWHARATARAESFRGLELLTCDGVRNAVMFERLFELVDAARDEIYVTSPYLTFPFTQQLAAARRRGVGVTVVSPRDNNHPALRKYIRWEARRSDLELRLYEGGMSHLKAMLIDDRWLVLGSSNFDVLSYRVHQEILAIVTDAEVIADFRRRVVDEDLACSTPAPAQAPRTGRLTYYRMRVTAALAVMAASSREHPR
jgi:cardiolipin synthase